MRESNLPQRLFNGNGLPKINSGQKALFLLICKKLNQREIIKYGEYEKIYFNEVKQYNQRGENYWDSEINDWGWRYRDYNDYEIEQMVKSWLLRALGTLIKKGYLIVLPRIEFVKSNDNSKLLK